MTRLSLRVRWGAPAEIALGPEPRGQLSVADTAQLSVVVLGAFLDRRTWQADLAVPGAASLTDAELAARAFPVHRLDWLGRAAGDFAVIVYDRVDDTVLMARNVAGTRPIFYRQGAEGVQVASDFAGLGPPARPLHDLADLESVGRFLIGDVPPPGRTIRGDIATVAAGHVVAVRPNMTPQARKWWQAPTRAGKPEFSLAPERLATIIAATVTETVLAHPGPVGIHLTGGLDSTAVATFAVTALREAGRPDPVGYAWQPAPGDLAGAAIDQRLIGQVCEELGISCRWQAPDSGAWMEPLALDPLSSPFTSTLHTELGVLKSAAGDGVRVILSGWGGDEFASYNGRHRRLRAHLGAPPLGHLAGPLRSTRRHARRAGFASDAVRAASPPPEAVSGHSARAMQLRLLERGFLSDRTDSWSVAGEAFGIEHAFPLLDRRVIDYVLTLPEACFPLGRVLMRTALRGVVPESVRLNTDKSDPAIERTPPLRRMAQAILLDRQRLDPDRLCFVDETTLLAALSDPDLPQPGKAQQAVQLIWRR